MSGDHRIPFANGWSLWPWVCVRGAGFPAREVLSLAAPRTAAATDAGASTDELAALFGEEAREGSRAIRKVASDPRFREAVLWQNRHAVRTGIERLLANPNSTNSKARQREHLVASYLQRYCTKNDTIGFFGPIGWATLAPSSAAAMVAPGKMLVTDRAVYFEHWSIDALAAKHSSNPELLPDLAPRRMPTVRLTGTVIRHSGGGVTDVGPDIARVIDACDGQTPARSIAASLIADPAVELDSEEEIYDLLEQLADRRVLIWRIEIPTALVSPERHLRALLDALPDGAPKASALADLDALERARDDIAKAAGDVDALDRAIVALESTFERVASTSATRFAGSMYAGRTLVYEDCRRDLEMRIDPALLDRIGPALSLVLASARWYTYQIGTRYRANLERLFDQMCAEVGSSTVSYITFFERAVTMLQADSIVEDVAKQLVAIWSRILAFDSHERRVVRSASALASDVESAFSAPRPGWPQARFHSPDLLIAASSPEQAMAGSSLVVMGELHMAMNTYAGPMWLKKCPHRAAVVQAYENDIDGICIVPVLPKETVNRAAMSSVSSRHMELEFGASVSHLPRHRVLLARDLVVVRSATGLRARTIDDRLSWDIIEALEYAMGTVNQAFSLIADLPHHPRITIDELVVAREQWRIAPEDVPFATMSRGAAQFASARAWAKQHGMPRWVFVKVPEEQKPVYVDFDSPIYVEALAKLVRRASRMTVSEMLPTLEQTWLPDAAGRTYTCELRAVAVDSEPWRPPGRGDGEK